MTTSTNGSSDSLWLRTVLDALVAVSLLIVVVVVFFCDAWVTRPLPARKIEIPQPSLEDILLGVTPCDHDDVGGLLSSLGSGYRYQEVKFEDILDGDALHEFDVIFFTCGGYPSEWLGEKVGEDVRDRSLFLGNPEIMDRARANLRSYVAQGGTLYASDYRYSNVAGAFEEFNAPTGPVRGAKDDVTAEVIDPDLRRLLGTAEINLHFDKPGWYAATFEGRDCEVLLQGDFKSLEGAEKRAPLLVRFPHGEGTVIFTSFHNAAQHGELKKKLVDLLEFLVFATVTAKSQKLVNKTMSDADVEPVRRSIFGASEENPSVTDVFECTSPGTLQFALAFRGRGVRLSLKVVSPDGRKCEHEGDSPFIVEVENAAVGQWKYTVTVVEVPHPNFPFTLTVGEKED